MFVSSIIAFKVMRRFIWFFAVILFVFFYSCKKESKICRIKIDDKKLEITLEQYSDSSFALCMTVNNERHSLWALNYPVYRFDYGDITGDGIPEIAVGVIKTTRFDPRRDKRLFLFRITKDFYIRPLWLGSRVAQPLIDFRIIEENGQSLIRTVEREWSGNYLVAEYGWQGFGLEFKRYIEREISLQKAIKI
jgi:hypothetical protein